MMVSSLFDIAKKFPRIIPYKDASLSRYAPEVDASSYLSFTLVMGLIFGIIGFVFGSVILALLLFSTALASFIIFPRMEEERQLRAMEAELPFALGTLALFLNLKLPFRESMKRLSGPTALGRQLEIINATLARGVPFSRAVLERATQLRSQKIKRAFSQLVSIHTSGAGGRSLEQLSADLVSAERLSLKEHAARAGLFGMAFIIACAVLPTFILLLAGVGPSTGFGLAPEFVVAGLLGGVPFVAALFILLMHKTGPTQVMSHATDERILVVTLAMGICATLVAFLFSSYLVAMLAVLFLIGTIVAYPQYMKDQHEDQLYDEMPDALMAASGLLPTARPTDFFDALTTNHTSAMKRECAISQKQLTSHASLDMVLGDWHTRIATPWMRRLVLLWTDVFNTNSFAELHTIAKDMLGVRELNRELQAMLAQQKYTLILGACIVPLILGQVVVLAGDLSQTFGGTDHSLEMFGDSLVPAYLIVYSLLCAAYLSYLDKTPSRSIIYFAILSVVSLGIFGFF